MSSTARHPQRRSALQQRFSLACLGIGLVLAAGSVAAQASLPPTASSTAPAHVAARLVAPGDAATERAYDDLDWTGRRAAPAVVRKEARAALVAGRRHCGQLRAGRRAPGVPARGAAGPPGDDGARGSRAARGAERRLRRRGRRSYTSAPRRRRAMRRGRALPSSAGIRPCPNASAVLTPIPAAETGAHPLRRLRRLGARRRTHPRADQLVRRPLPGRHERGGRARHRPLRELQRLLHPRAQARHAADRRRDAGQPGRRFGEPVRPHRRRPDLPGQGTRLHDAGAGRR